VDKENMSVNMDNVIVLKDYSNNRFKKLSPQLALKKYIGEYLTNRDLQNDSDLEPDNVVVFPKG